MLRSGSSSVSIIMDISVLCVLYAVMVVLDSLYCEETTRINIEAVRILLRCTENNLVFPRR